MAILMLLSYDSDKFISQYLLQLRLLDCIGDIVLAVINCFYAGVYASWFGIIVIVDIDILFCVRWLGFLFLDFRCTLYLESLWLWIA